MRRLRTGFFLVLLSFSTGVPAHSARSVGQQIEAWLAQHPPVAADQPIVQRVKVLNSAAQLAALCEQPQWHSVGSVPRLAGKRTLIAQCGQRRTFLQLEVQAQGGWYVAARALAAGETLQPDDIDSVRGDLAALPAGALLQRHLLIDQVTQRALAPGQTLTQSQLRPRWRVRQGQQVELIAQGEGFRLRSKGIAQNNAAVGQPVRVKTASGQRVQGLVSVEGSVLLSVQ